jgi:hypothetical protein
VLKKLESTTNSESKSTLKQPPEKTGVKLTDKVCKKLLANINYSMGRNSVSNRPVKQNLLTVELLQKKFKEQNGCCYWSGLSMDQSNNFIKHHPLAISCERLDNKKDYTEENVVLTLRLFNLGRMAFPADDFLEVILQLKTELSK